MKNKYVKIDKKTTGVFLTQGKMAIIDTEDIPLISGYRWYANKNRNTFYAVSGKYENGKRITVKMHRIIFGDTYLMVDHKNGLGLDNRKDNLRAATHSQNGSNRKLNINNSSGFKGVFWTGYKWKAEIKVNKKIFHIGYFDSRIKAAKQYNFMAKKLVGDFARINDLQGGNMRPGTPGLTETRDEGGYIRRGGLGANKYADRARTIL